MLLVVAGLAQRAEAGTFELFGMSPRAMAMGGAMTAEADDYSAAFYNPALIAWGDQAKVGLGGTFMQPALSVRTQNPSKALDCTYCAGQPSAASTSGVLLPFGGKIQNRLALGLASHIPTPGVAPTSARPTRRGRSGSATSTTRTG